MRNDAHNELLPWQTQEPEESPTYSIKPFIASSHTKKTQLVLHNQLNSKSKKFYRTKKSTTFTQPSQKVSLKIQNRKAKHKSTCFNNTFGLDEESIAMKNWKEKSINTCPLKVTQLYSEAESFARNFKNKYKHYEDMEKKKLNEGLQNFTNNQIKSKSIDRNSLKISFSEFLQLRKLKKQTKQARKIATNQIEIEPAIHVQVGKNINYCNSNFFIRQCKNGHKTTKSVSNTTLKDKRKLVYSTIKRSIENNKFFEELSISISKCQDLKSFSLSNYD